MSPRSSEQVVSGVAHLLAAHDPAVWRRLLAEHTSDRTGHCPACRSTATGTPTWPCTLRLVAEHAQRLSEVSAAAREQVSPVGPDLAPAAAETSMRLRPIRLSGKPTARASRPPAGPA